MVRQQEWRVRFWVACSGLALFVVGLLLMVYPALATIYPVAIDDNLQTFSDGIFQRVALTPYYSPQATADMTGGIQLARSGVLNPWLNSTGQLINPRTASGVAVLGSRIFMIGGTESGTGNVASITWTVIDQITGEPVNPNGDLTSGAVVLHPNPLPAVRGTDTNIGAYNCTAPVAARANPAVTGVKTGGTDATAEGFIYVMGGSIPCGPNSNVSIYSVLIGKVADTATITGAITWREGPPIPSATVDYTDGLALASAINVTTAMSETYVYLIGGKKTYLSNPTNPIAISEGLRTVYYAKVDPATGDLKKLDGSIGWNTSSTLIPLMEPIGATDGLWDATAIPVHTVDKDNIAHDGFYLMSGQRSIGPPATYNPQIYLAEVSSTTGELTWDTTPGVGNPGPEATLPETRIGMGGAFYNGKLYLIGGREPALATIRNTVMTAVISDDLRLQLDTSGQVSFVGLNTPVLPNNRFASGVATIFSIPCTGQEICPPPEAYSPAFIYVIGGEDESGATNSLYFGRVGGDNETSATTVVDDGWYYAKAISVKYGSSDVSVKELTWNTKLDPANDIALEYRLAVTASGLCDAADTFNNSQWITVDGSPSITSTFSVDGNNSTVFTPSPIASCLQYRAHLTTGNTEASPILLGVQVVTDVPGAPDIKLDATQSQIIATQSSVTGIKVTLKNENLFEPPTLRADFPTGGSFWVDLCISPPGRSLTAADFAYVPNSGPACSKAFASVNKVSLDAYATYTIPAGAWRDSSTGAPLTDFSQFFTMTNRLYKVYVDIDWADPAITNEARNINEGTKGGETNNINLTSPLQITLGQVPTPTPVPTSAIYLPNVQRH